MRETSASAHPSQASVRMSGSIQLRVVVGVLLCLALIPLSCGGGGSDGQETDNLKRLGIDLERSPVPGATPGPEELIDFSDPANLTDFQRAIIEDGVVTFAEYESAMYAVMACVEAHGIEIVGGLTADPSGKQLGFATRLGMDFEEARENGRKTQQCHNQYAGVVTMLWAFQNQPTEQQRQEARAALDACLREAGAPLPEDPAPQDFFGLVHDYAPCFEQVQREFGIPNFVG